jgi:hypothetical protein
MATTTPSESARIIQFPIRARAGARDFRQEVRPVKELAMPGEAVAVSGNWYHDAAIQAEKTRKP